MPHRIVPSALLLAALACGGNSPPATPEASGQPPSVRALSETAESMSQSCEHARDRIAKLTDLDWRLAELDAPADQKATTRERRQDLTKAIRENFVDVCLGLEREQLRCIVNIDDYVDAAIAAKRALLDCRTQDPASCEQWIDLIDNAEASAGRCLDVVDQVAGESWARSRPEPETGRVIGGMAQDGGKMLTRPYGNGQHNPGEGGEGSRDADRGFGGAGKIVPNVRQAVATVRGPLNRDIVRRIVRAHIEELRSCYSAGLASNPSLVGEVTIDWTIDAEGHVSVSKAVDADTFADPDVPNCMATAARQWTFPKPLGGASVQVSLPFILEPR